MWFLPSYRRHEKLAELAKCPGGMPDNIVVLVNEDDPQREGYKWQSPWPVEFISPGARVADAWRAAFARYPNERFYGILSDDCWPETPHWHASLIQAAGDKCIALANGVDNFPRLRNVVVLGGDLVRAMGGLVPSGFKHNYVDDVWETFAKDFGLLRPCADVIVRHVHPLVDGTAVDETYVRGSHDIDEDRVNFDRWYGSKERMDACQSIGKLLGINGTVSDLSNVHLVIAIPSAGHQVDVGFMQSLRALEVALINRQIGFSICRHVGGSHVGKSRERSLWQAMAKGATHIIFIDDDMHFDPQLVMRLLCSDHEFSGVVGVRKVEKLSLCFNPLPGDQRFHENTGFLEVRDVGFAFIMLKRSVVDKMCAAYPELKYNVGKDAAPEWALFMDIYPSDPMVGGERFSEDYAFCRRWRAIGGEIWVDPEAALGHVGVKTYTGRISDWYRQLMDKARDGRDGEPEEREAEVPLVSRTVVAA